MEAPTERITYPKCEYITSITPEQKKTLKKKLDDQCERWQGFSLIKMPDTNACVPGMVSTFVRDIFCPWYGPATAPLFRGALQCMNNVLGHAWGPDLPEDEKHAILFIVKCMHRSRKLTRLAIQIRDTFDPRPDIHMGSLGD